MRRNFPRPYTTTYLPCYSATDQHVTHTDSEITFALRLYLRVEIPSFPLLSCARLGLFRCRFGLARPVLALQSDLPPHAPSILSLHLPGLPLRVPRRWWKVRCSKPLLIPGSLENTFSLFPSCRLAPSFPAFSFLMFWYCFFF